jgi:tetratricopeptide (TPR) repeat protein
MLYKNSTLKTLSLCLILAISCTIEANAQSLRIPQNTNFSCSAGRQLGVTDIEIKWNSPGVKGREGKIWGTDIAPYGFTVLGFGSQVASPWRAGADENTTISFSTDVKINGKNLAAGKYGFFIAVYPDSCVLIFNKNTAGWGSYFYREDLDVMRVSTVQQKNIATSQERLIYTFSNQTEQSIEVALEWEKWKIPFKIEVDLKNTTLEAIRNQMSGAIGFDPASLQAAANWCLQNEVNYKEALNWINSASDPSLGGQNTFTNLSIKSKLLTKLGNTKEAESIWQTAIDKANAIELHTYGRQLMAQKKFKEAMAIFESNYKKNNGAWPTNVGMMRGYSALGDTKKALEFAKQALTQAPDEVNKKNLEASIKQLEQGKPLN